MPPGITETTKRMNAAESGQKSDATGSAMNAGEPGRSNAATIRGIAGTEQWSPGNHHCTIIE